MVRLFYYNASTLQMYKTIRDSNMVANIPQIPDPPGSKGQIKLFHIMVILHIKLNGIMNAEIWLQTFRSQTPLFFLKVVMLHIKLKGTEHRAPCKHIFCTYAHPQPVGWI